MLLHQLPHLHRGHKELASWLLAIAVLGVGIGVKESARSISIPVGRAIADKKAASAPSLDTTIPNKSIDSGPMDSAPMDNETENEAIAPISTSAWEAIENRNSLGFPTLYVTGEVSLPNPGYDAELIRPIEQNLLDDTLILVLRIDEPSGNFLYPSVVTPHTVRYDDEFYLGGYEQVVVRAEDGSTLETIMVETVE